MIRPWSIASLTSAKGCFAHLGLDLPSAPRLSPTPNQWQEERGGKYHGMGWHLLQLPSCLWFPYLDCFGKLRSLFGSKIQLHKYAIDKIWYLQILAGRQQRVTKIERLIEHLFRCPRFLGHPFLTQQVAGLLR